MDDLYQENILDHFAHPRNKGDAAGLHHHAGQQNLSCGDGLVVGVELDAEGRITKIIWTGEGCAISQASASILSEVAVGKTLAELQAMLLVDVVAALGVEISPAREKCAMLFVQTVRQIP